MTSQQLKEELKEARGVNQIFVPQKNQSFAKGLTQTETMTIKETTGNLMGYNYN